MIYLRLDDEFYRYDIYHITKMFFPGKQIIVSENTGRTDISGSEKEETGDCIFIRASVKETGAGNGSFNLIIDIKAPGYQTSYSREKSFDTGQDTLKLLKQELSRLLYEALSIYTKKKIPWGILTGIRPAKIAMEMIEEGMDNQRILEHLEHYYMVSHRKARLALEIARTEKEILDRSKDNMIGVYIGIPFCRTRCLYCSFTSYCVSRYEKLMLVDKYIDMLKKELYFGNELIKEKGYTIQSIYIGGGTPTSISARQMKDLLGFIEETFSLENLEEFTLEAGRPDTIDEEKLLVIKNSRVNRISINPQTMNDATLRLIGRNHSSEDVRKAFYLARDVGFNNINMDVIVGLPGENCEMFRNTLEEIKKMEPESLTVHALAIKRASRLNEEQKEFEHVPDEEAAGMVDMAYEYALSMGMRPYYMYRQKNIAGNLENVGYCKPGFESIYNVQIMEEKQTLLAFGAGGVSKVVYSDENKIERAFNVKSPEEYIGRIDEMIARKRELFTCIHSSPRCSR